jgi:hypothetical protein
MTAAADTLDAWLDQVATRATTTTPAISRPFPAPLPKQSEGGADRSLRLLHPPDRLAAAGSVFQGGHPLGTSPHGRPPFGKLLPRFAGPIAEYVFAHPKAARGDLLDFIDETFGVQVSRIAL